MLPCSSRLQRDPLCLSGTPLPATGWINLTPDEVFTAYNDLTPLLPSKQSIPLWGLNLVSQLFDALSLDLQEALHTDPLHLSPNLYFFIVDIS
jgi:hypothetical protein